MPYRGAALPESISDITTDPTTWRLTTPGGIPYKRHSEGGHEGRMTWDSLEVTEKYLIEASQLQAFLREMFPWPVTEADEDDIPIIKYGTLQGTLNITASEVAWTGYPPGQPFDPFSADPDAPFSTYARLALVTVKYNDSLDKGDNGGKGSDPDDPTTFLEIGASASGEFIHTPIPGSSWENASGESTNNTTPTAPAQIIVPETEWSLTWPRVSGKYFNNVLIGRLRNIMGKVNSTSYSLLYNAPAETLLFVGWDMSEERQVIFNSELGTLSFLQRPLRVSMKILEKRVVTENNAIKGHNHVWRPGSGWQKLLINGTDPLYQSYNYNNLFARTA